MNINEIAGHRQDALNEISLHGDEDNKIIDRVICAEKRLGAMTPQNAQEAQVLLDIAAQAATEEGLKHEAQMVRRVQEFLS